VERNLIQELRVGLFVVIFLTIIGAAVFILSGGAEAFRPEYALQASFKDVKGLKAGAVVRLAGIDVGMVTRVDFAAPESLAPEPEGGWPERKPGEPPPQKEINVFLKLKSEYQGRIREDSVASISSIGLLGDMYVSLSVGDPKKTMLTDGVLLTSAESVDVLSYADKATSIVENAASISKKVDLMIGSDEEAAKAGIANSLASIEGMLRDAKEGDGVLNVLLYDKATASRVKSIVANADGIVADVKAITSEVRTGKGLAHAMVYGEEGEKLTRSLSDAADALDGLMTDIRTGDSLAHALLYDPGKAALMDDLQATVANINGVTSAVNSGDGTLGLLVRDPQLYEDMRALMGGAQRNALLRAYIRATVAKGRNENAGAWTAPGDDGK